MKQDGEKILNVPLSKAAMDALKERARSKGRAAGREASKIITRKVLGGAK